ncbi:hypothetical protein F4703DRAFT_1796172 [Phycomyces blakesleeanus]
MALNKRLYSEIINVLHPEDKGSITKYLHKFSFFLFKEVSELIKVERDRKRQKTWESVSYKFILYHQAIYVLDGQSYSKTTKDFIRAIKSYKIIGNKDLGQKISMKYVAYYCKSFNKHMCLA